MRKYGIGKENISFLLMFYYFLVYHSVVVVAFSVLLTLAPRYVPFSTMRYASPFFVPLVNVGSLG